QIILICRPRLQSPPANRLLYLRERIKIKILKKGVSHFIVISKSEIENYNKYWQIAKENMSFIPFKVNTEEILSKFEKEDGNFIYSGGNSLRDYKTFFKAVEGTDINVKVLSTLDFKNITIPKNVEIIDNSGTPEEFYGPCARSKFAVFPIKPNYIRSAAQGSYLGAMYMGKAVIVSDTPGVRDIINDNFNGLIVPPGDVEALREKILKLWHDENLRKKIEYNAQRDIQKNYTHNNYIENIYNIFNLFTQH
ncbi:MAG: glycosyltransferase family 4 protein, partial [Bacillota bacterium]